METFDNNECLIEMALDFIHLNNISQRYGKKARMVKLIKDRIEDIKKSKEKATTNLKLPIDGKTLMEEFNIKQGVIVGKLLQAVTKQYVNNPSMDKKEALSVAREEFKKLLI